MSYRDDVMALVYMHESGNRRDKSDAAARMRKRAAEIAARADAQITELQQSVAERDAKLADLETAIKRQAAAVKMLDMSHVARAETMMQHAQVLHDQSNTAALESERAANALLTERIAELERSVTG